MKALTTIPNSITALRLGCSAVLLCIKPLSVAFYAVYLICGVSDVLDGYIARKAGAATALGATLDSIADLVFFGVLLVIYIPLFQWQGWMLWLIGLTVTVRLVSLLIGFLKYHAFAFLHTYANKAAGALFFLFPFLYAVFGFAVTAMLLCGIALLSSVEELTINLISKKLNRNVRCVLDVHWMAKS